MPKKIHSTPGRDSGRAQRVAFSPADKIHNWVSRCTGTTQPSQNSSSKNGRGGSAQSKVGTLESKLEYLKGEISRLDLAVEREGLRAFTLKSVTTELSRISNFSPRTITSSQRGKKP
jgi:hypothetical protein